MAHFMQDEQHAPNVVQDITGLWATERPPYLLSATLKNHHHAPIATSCRGECSSGAACGTGSCSGGCAAAFASGSPRTANETCRMPASPLVSAGQQACAMSSTCNKKLIGAKEHNRACEQAANRCYAFCMTNTAAFGICAG